MNENITGIFIVLIILIFLMIYLYYLSYLNFYLRKKGYKNPFLASFIGVLFLIPLIIFFITGFDLLSLNSNFFDFGFIIVGLILFAGLATTIIVILLPTRKSRVPGPRKIHVPYFMIGIALLALLPFGVLFILLLSKSIFYPIMLIISLIPTILYCFYMARRIKSSSLTQATRMDNRPPVLYLRPFIQEEEAFIEATFTEMDLLSYFFSKMGITLEKYFIDDLSKSIGPFIALGNPEDYTPPEGAARKYASDKDWIDQFRQLSLQAACILMEVGHSENLQWELESLKKYSLQEKLFVITRPKKKKGWVRNFLFYISRKIGKLGYKRRDNKKVPWEDFKKILSRSGYILNFPDPGPGAVLTFDCDSKSILLATNAYTPSEYIKAIQKWRLEKKYIGELT